MSRAFIQKRLPFKPTDIGGCQLWLDGADASTITGTTTVTQWRDKSGNARNLGVGSGTTSYANNAITLNSSYMFVTSAVDLIKVTVFIVVKTTGGNNQTVFEGRPNTNVDYNSLDGFGFYMDGTSSVRFYGQQPSGTFSTFGVNTSSPRLFSFQSIGTSVSGWYDGVSQSGGTLSSTRTSTAQGFAIGAYWSGSAYDNIIANTSLYEIIVYNSDVSNNQRQQVESYLAQKWGLRQQLPQGHPGTRGIVYPSDPVNLLVRVPYQSAFVPTTAGNCQLWLDAADSATLTGTSPVTQWRDKSGNARNTTSYAGTPALTTNAINGVQAINFNGSSSFTGSIPGSGNAYTIFFVGNFNASSGQYAGLLCFSSPGNIDYGAGGITNTKLSDTSVYSTVNGTNTVFTSNTLSIPFVYSLVIDGTYINNFVNGTQQTPADRAQSGTFNFTNYVVANRAGSTGSIFLNGFVGEIIVYLNGLATLQRQQVEGYLAWKWGLQSYLPANHPYKNASPNITNQFGISRPPNVLPIPPITISARSKTTFQTRTFTYTGANQTFQVPSTISPASVTVYMWGAGGGGYYPTQSYGGAGCYLTGILSVTAGENLNIVVGQAGTIQFPAQSGVTTRFGGGGGIPSTGGNGNAQYNGSGGGRSAIQRTGADIVSAGAGGGGGTQYNQVSGHNGGTGSWTGTGGNGAEDKYGLGGTQSAGGATQGNGQAGTALVGGQSDPWGGGGGGGFFGGGGGSDNGTYGSGGGGGSSYTDLLSSKSGSNGILNVAPNTGSPYYVSGVAVGGTQALSGNGGPGLVVLTYYS
jgi:hypothetical protein